MRREVGWRMLRGWVSEKMRVGGGVWWVIREVEGVVE